MQRKARGVVSGVLVSLRQGAIKEPGVEPPWSQVQKCRHYKAYWSFGEVGMVVVVTGWVLLTRESVTSKSWQSLWCPQHPSHLACLGLLPAYIRIVKIILFWSSKKIPKVMGGADNKCFTSSSELSDTWRSGRGGSAFWAPVVVNLTHEMRRITFQLSYYHHHNIYIIIIWSDGKDHTVKVEMLAMIPVKVEIQGWWYLRLEGFVICNVQHNGQVTTQKM